MSKFMKITERVVSGHQPVYLPWLGFFHKLYLCDVFVFMDTVQYLDGDWNNRNYIRNSQGSTLLTVPIDRRASQGKMLDDIFLHGYNAPIDKKSWQRKHWTAIVTSYKKAPFFEYYATDLEYMYLEIHWSKLVDLCWHQFKLFSKWFGLDDREVVRMSEVEFTGSRDELVLDHCRKLHADAVVFGTHGRDYVRTNLFSEYGVQVYFQDFHHPTYQQRFQGFESHMAALDLLMNYGPEQSLGVLLEGNVTFDELRTSELWVNRIGGCNEDSAK